MSGLIVVVVDGGEVLVREHGGARAVEINWDEISNDWDEEVLLRMLGDGELIAPYDIELAQQIVDTALVALKDDAADKKDGGEGSITDRPGFQRALKSLKGRIKSARNNGVFAHG